MQPKFKKNYYRNLFTWKELVALINIRPLMTVERVKIPQVKDYKWVNSVWTLNPNCYPPLLLKEIIQNNLCYLRDMSRCSRKVNDLAKRLEEEYNGSVDAHIYICRNPSLRHPFGIHFDMNDNYIVQCEGKTHWKVWDKVENKDQPQSQLSVEGDPILDVVLNPGDVITVPAYHPHLAISITPRLSISFPLMKDVKLAQERYWIKI